MSETLDPGSSRSVSAALELVCRLLIELDTLHARGRCHGLIAPPHVRLDEAGRPELIGSDEALALRARLREQPDHPLPPDLLGYLPSEAWEAEPDPSGDLYGLGRLLFVLLTGEPPQHGDRLADLAPEAGPPATRLFERSYTRQSRRYPDARAAIEDLLGAEAGQGPALTAPLAAALGADGVLGDEAVPAAQTLAEMAALINQLDEELATLPDLGRALIPLGGLLLAIVLWPHFNWMSLCAIPLALMLRMVRGDLRQKRLFLGPMLDRIAAFCEARQLPRLQVWRHVAGQPESYRQIWVWMQYAEPFFLPEPLRSPPRRMGGVSKVPWS